MAADASRSKELKIAFILDEASLRVIVAILESVSTPIEYRIKCSDGFSVTYASLADVLKFPNSSQRRVTELSLATPWDTTPQVWLRFRNQTSLSSIESHMRGTEQQVFLLAGSVDEAIDPLQQWYTPLAIGDPLRVVFGTLGLATIFGFLAFRNANAHHLPNSTEISLGTGMFSMIAVLAALSALGGRLFPVGAFLIGDGIRRNRAVIFWRRIVGGGLIISVLGSIVASLILK